MTLKDRVEENIKVCFKICYDNTPENRRIHEAFQEFAKRETDNGYLLAIKRLLEAYSTDWKYATLHQKMQELEMSFDEVLKELDNKQEEKVSDKKTFG